MGSEYSTIRDILTLMKKEVGIIGLGKMGSNLALNLLGQDWRVVGFNRTVDKAEALEGHGLEVAGSIQALIKALTPPRTILVLVSAGYAIEDILLGEQGVIRYVESGDIVVDWGNTYFKEDQRRAEMFGTKGVHFLDAGISGGPSGARNGACVMVGGQRKIFESIEDVFKDIALPNGYAFFDGYGAGHFVKMVHNGIEYGMMQAIAEGFDLMRQSDYSLDLEEVVRIYNTGSVIESRLTKWLQEGFADYGTDLESIPGGAGEGGGAAGQTGKSEGVWTVETAQEMEVPVQVIEDAVHARRLSREYPNYQGKIINVLRNKFGGHSV